LPPGLVLKYWWLPKVSLIQKFDGGEKDDRVIFEKKSQVSSSRQGFAEFDGSLKMGT
jgi:hypothetical protein